MGRSFRTLLKLLAAGGAAVSISSAAQATLVYDTSLASPGFYNGSGNPNEGFTVNTVNGIELGLGVNIRFVGPVHPTSSNVYDVAVGFSTVPLAKWNFEYSVNLGNSGRHLSDVQTRLTITNLANSQVILFDPYTIPDNAHFDGTTTHNGGALCRPTSDSRTARTFPFSPFSVRPSGGIRPRAVAISSRSLCWTWPARPF